MSSPADGDKREQRLRRRRELRPRYEETERAWRAANADRVRAYRRRWIENNAVRQREASRVWNRRAYAARMRDVARRRNAVDRARRWAEQNPEKVKAAKIRYRLASPEKVKESSRRYYEQHKAEISERRLAREDPQKVAEARARYRENYVRKAPSEWKASPEQREAYRRASRDQRRLDRRLAAAGLPSRQLHRVPVAEVRANVRAADAFFSQPRPLLVRKAIAREEFGTPPAWLRSLAVELATIRNRPEILEAGRRYLARHGERLRSEVRMDSVARHVRGLPPLDEDREVLARLTAALQVASPGLGRGGRPYTFVPPRARVRDAHEHGEAHSDLGR